MLLQSFRYWLPVLLLFVCLGISAAAPVTVPELVASKVAPQTVTYKTIGETALSLHLFQPEGAAPKGGRPAMVFIHGGGWGSGSPELFFPHCRYFAGRGLVAVSVQYRLVTKTSGTTVLDCVQDCLSAVRYLRQHAKELGIDPTCIAVAGDSAGGHLAACVGILRGCDAAGEDKRISSAANAMILYNPITDTTGKWGRGMGKELALQLSPVHHLRRKLPPTLLMHGDRDTIVDIDDSRTFEAFMRQYRNRCDFLELPGANHAFVLPNYGTLAQNVQALRTTDTFLASLGYLHDAPTLVETKGK